MKSVNDIQNQMYRIADLSMETGNMDRYMRAEETGKRYAGNIVKYLQSIPGRQNFSFLGGLRQAIDFNTRVPRNVYAPEISNAAKGSSAG